MPEPEPVPVPPHAAAAASSGSATVLAEPVGLTLESGKCDAKHDPAAPAGGDLFSFKGVFMVQLPRFVEAAVKAKGVLSPAQLAAGRKLVADSADAAWAARALPPFAANDVCNEFVHPPAAAGGPPKFTWDWAPTPTAERWTCLDARTQAQALALFAADLRLSQAAE